MPRDDILLLDMLLAARDAVEFAAGLTSEAFERNRMAQRATLKSVEIVGGRRRASVLRPRKRIRKYPGPLSWECGTDWSTNIPMSI